MTESEAKRNVLGRGEGWLSGEQDTYNDETSHQPANLSFFSHISSMFMFFLRFHDLLSIEFILRYGRSLAKARLNSLPRGLPHFLPRRRIMKSIQTSREV